MPNNEIVELKENPDSCIYYMICVNQYSNTIGTPFFMIG